MQNVKFHSTTFDFFLLTHWVESVLAPEPVPEPALVTPSFLGVSNSSWAKNICNVLELSFFKIWHHIYCKMYFITKIIILTLLPCSAGIIQISKISLSKFKKLTPFLIVGILTC